MHIYKLSDDIKGNKTHFRDDYEEWIEQACGNRSQNELYESRYEKWQREEFEKLEEEGIDRTRIEW